MKLESDYKALKTNYDNTSILYQLLTSLAAHQCMTSHANKEELHQNCNGVLVGFDLNFDSNEWMTPNPEYKTTDQNYLH